MGLNRRTKISVLKEQRAMAQNLMERDEQEQTATPSIDAAFDAHQQTEDQYQKDQQHLAMMLEGLRALAASELEESSPEEQSKAEYEGIQDELNLLAHSLGHERNLKQDADEISDMLVKIEGPYTFDLPK